MTDGYCICEPGYEFYDQDMILRSDEDGAVDCQPIVYDRCSSNQVRSDSGSCVPASGKACDASCNNGTGTYVASLGVCQCDEQPDLDTVCNQKCRDEKTQIQVNGSTGELQLYNPITRELSSLSEDSSTNGLVSKVSCASGSDCHLHSIAVASTGFSGSYDLPPLISETSRRRLSTASTSTSIPNPMVCLTVGNGLLFDLSVAGSYPIYLKDSMLNTNPSFDYGAFRALAAKVNSNSSTVSAFAFSFTEAGTYVFGNSLNAAAQTIIVVMKAGTSCPTEAPIVPLNEKNLITVSAKRRTDDIILAPDWGLIVGLLCGLFGVVIAVIAGLYYFRAKSWTNTAVKSVKGYRAKNQLANLSAMHSKGTVAVTNDSDQSEAVSGALLGTEPMTVEKKQFHLGKQEQVKGATMEYRPDLERWDEEDLDLRELIDRLQFHHEAVTKSFEDQKGGVKELMQRLQAEAVELKRLFVNALVTSDLMSPEVKNPAAALEAEVPETLPVSEISGRPRSRSVAGREKFLLENLERDLQDRNRFEQKKTAMINGVSAGLHEIEGWGEQLADLTGAMVQDMSLQVDDRAPERTSSKEETCIERVRSVLGELKTLLGSDPMTQTSSSLIHLAEAEKGRREVGDFVLEASQRYFTARPTIDGDDQESRDSTNGIQRLLELHDDVEKAQNKEDEALFRPLQSLQKFGAALPQVLAAIEDLESSFHRELDAVREEQNPVKEHAVQAQMQSRLSKLMKEVAAGAKIVNEKVNKEAPRTVKLRRGAQQAENALSRALGSAKEQWIIADQERRDLSAATVSIINEPESAPSTLPEDQATPTLRDKTLFEIKDLLIELTSLLQRNGGASILASQQLGVAPQVSALVDPRVTTDVKRSRAWASDESYPQHSTAEKERQRDNLMSDLRKVLPSASQAASTHMDVATRQESDVVREEERDQVLHREVEGANALRTQHDEEEQSLESQFREEELAIEQEYLRELSSLEMEFESGSGDEADGDATEPPDNLFDDFSKNMEGDESLPPRLTETEESAEEMSGVLMDDDADIIAQLNDVYSEAWNNRVRILAKEEALRKEKLNERIRRKRMTQKSRDPPLSDGNLDAVTLEAVACKDAILEEVVKKQDEMDALEQEAINNAVNNLRKQVEDCQDHCGGDSPNDRDAITQLVTEARNCAKKDRAKAEKTIAHAESELQKLLNEYDHDFSAMEKEVESERMRLEAKLKGALAKRHGHRGGSQGVKKDEVLEQTESSDSDSREDLETELEAFTDGSIKELRDKHFQLQQEIEAQKTQGVVAMAVADAQLAYLDELSTGRVITNVAEHDDNSLSRELKGELLEALAFQIPMQIEQWTQEKVDKLRADYVLSCAERRRELEADAAMRRAKLADRMNRRRQANGQDTIDEKAHKTSTASESRIIDEQERVALAEIVDSLVTATEALGETERTMCEALAQTLASTLQKYGADIKGQTRGAATFASPVVYALDALEDTASRRAEAEAQNRAAIEQEIERVKDDSSKSFAALNKSLEVEKRRQEEQLKQRLAQRREQQLKLIPVGSSPEKVAEMNAVLVKQEVGEKLRLEDKLGMQTQRALDQEIRKQRDRKEQLKQQLRDAIVAETAAAAMKEAVVQTRSEYLKREGNDEELAALMQLWKSRPVQKHLPPTRTVQGQQSVITADDNSALQSLHDEHAREWEALKARFEDEMQRRKDQLAQQLQRKRQILQNNSALSPTERKRAEVALDREEERENQAIEASAVSLDQAITLASQRAKDHASGVISGSLASTSADLDAALEATRRQHEEAQRKLREDLETERRKQEQLLRERLRQRRAARRDGSEPMLKAEAEDAQEANMKQKLEEKLCAQEDEAWAALRKREQQELDAILAPLEAVVSQRLDDADLAERRARQELNRLAEEHDRHLSELRDSLEAEKKRQQLALRDKLQRKRDRRESDGASVSDEEVEMEHRQAMEALDASFEADLATAEAEAGETRREKEIELLAEICACSANRTAEEAALALLDGARLEAERVRAEYEAALASRLQRSAAADAMRREEMAKRLAERKLKRRQQRGQQVSQETTGIIAPLRPPLDSRHNDREGDDGSLGREITNVQAAHARGVRSRQEQLDAETAVRKAALAARLDHKRRAAVKSGESRASEAEMERALLLEEQQELAAIERDRALREKELKAETMRERERLAKNMREADESGAADIERQLAACKQAHDSEAAKLEEALRAERARQELALKQRLTAKRQRRAADGGDTEANTTSDQEAQEAQAALSEQERAARQQLADRQQQELADVARKLEQEAEAQRQAAFDLQAAAERELKRLEEEHIRERRALQVALLADRQKREDQLREKLAKKKAARHAKGGFESPQDDVEDEIALAALQEEIMQEQVAALAHERGRQEAAMRSAAAELQEAAEATAKAAAASRQAQDEATRIPTGIVPHYSEPEEVGRTLQRLHEEYDQESRILKARIQDEIQRRKDQLAQQLQRKRQILQNNSALSPTERKRAEVALDREEERENQAIEASAVSLDQAITLASQRAKDHASGVISGSLASTSADLDAALEATRRQHEEAQRKLREDLETERRKQEQLLRERLRQRRAARRDGSEPMLKAEAEDAQEANMKQKLEEKLCAQEDEAWAALRKREQQELDAILAPLEAVVSQRLDDADLAERRARQELNRLAEEHDRHLSELRDSLEAEKKRQQLALRDKLQRKRDRRESDGASVSDEEVEMEHRQAMEALDASFEADLATAEAEAGETRREKEIELLAEICACSANRTAEEAALALLDGARLEAERVRAEYEAALASRLQRSAAADAMRREEMAKRLAERKLKRRQQRGQQVSQETTGIIAPLRPPLDSRHNDREGDDGSLGREITNVQAAHARGVRSRQEQLDAETAVRKAALAARLDHKRRAAVKSGESRASEAEMERALLLEEQQELAAIERDRALREKELKAETMRERERLAKNMREADESGAADIERQLAACKQAHDSEAAKLEEALRAERARQELALKQRLTAKRQRRAADGGDTEANTTSDQEAQEAQAALSEQERAARQQLADRQQQELADVARKLEQEAEAQRQAAFDLQAAAERELKRLEEEHIRERRALQVALLADRQKREDQLREKLAKKKAARHAKGGFESPQDDVEDEIALAALQEEIMQEQVAALAHERGRQEAAMRSAAAELQEAAEATAKAAAASRQAQEEAARVAAEFERHRVESQQLEAADASHSKQKLADRLAEKRRRQQLKQQQAEKEQVKSDDTRVLQEEAERLRLEAQIEAQLVACREAHDAEASKLRESLQAERERQERALQERIARRKEKRFLADAQASARVDMKAAEEAERKQQQEEEAALAVALAAQEQEAWEIIQRKQDEDLRALQEQKHQQEQERAERQHQLAQKEMNRLQEEHERELRALTTSLAQEQARQEEKLQQRIAQRRARKQRQDEEAAATSAKKQQSIADAEEAARLSSERKRVEALAEAQAQEEAEAEEKERQEIAARLAQKMEEERARQRREKEELEARLAREAEEQAVKRATALALQLQQQALETADKMAREFDTNLRELRETHSADGAAQKARLESRIAAKKARKLRELEEKRELERQRLHTRQQQEAEEAARAEQEREVEAAEAARQAEIDVVEELVPIQPRPEATLTPVDDEAAPKTLAIRQQQPTEEDDLVAELRGKLELEAEDRRHELQEEKRVELERLTQDELRQITQIETRVASLLAEERAAMIELLTSRLQALPAEMVKQREAAEREHTIQLQRLTLLLQGRGQQQKSRVRARMVQKRVLIEDEFSRKAKLVTAAMNQRFMQEKMGLRLKKQTPPAPVEEAYENTQEEPQQQDEIQSPPALSAELAKRLEEMLEDRLLKIEALVTEFQVKAQTAPPAPVPPKEIDPEESNNSLIEYQIAIAEAVAVGCRYEKRASMDKQSLLLVDSFGVLDASVVTSKLPQAPVDKLDDRMRARLGFVELLLQSVATNSELTTAVVIVEHFGRGNNGDADYASFSPSKQENSEKGTLFLSRAALQELSTGQLAIVILHALAQGHAHVSNLTEPQFICHLYKLLVRCYQGLFTHFQQERAASTVTVEPQRKSVIAEAGKTMSISDKAGGGHWQTRLLEMEGFLTRMESRNASQSILQRSQSSRLHLLTKQREGNAGTALGSSADLWQQEQVQILQEKLDSAEKLYLQVLRQHEQQTQSVEYWQDLLAEQRDAEYEEDTFDEEDETEGDKSSKVEDPDATERQRQREVRAQELQEELERTSQALEGTRKERDELFTQCQQLRDQLNELRGGRTTG
ncbi:hypothetical protein P3T76_000003 [Phytophthora citrophthora]|uniref:Uncharacterized protein n=1 Tax=Phytophthora citrophthora TaxID=4793 RepID=A0AAD9H0L6_9STRA|nr:hypothetical protein P3T76_000003 [Phytophthora citrophthora]